ncbi:MAG: hypothetical protein IJD38_12740 [Clostridia bacterium]|nr:hypothetical protein [Clostridia bacterium]
MNQSDAYYRAFLAYKALISGQRDCERDRHSLADAPREQTITVTRIYCTVDEAWIRAIETGLVHIEKAIKEDRQFIYSNGEVVPIERVRHVSKDSVEHLARHAELITRAPEGEDIIPDKLYTVERLSDYAVYENRFLYMLLCYLRDFVTLRYRKLLELTNLYSGQLTLSGEVTLFGRTLSLNADLKDTRPDDPYLRLHNPARDMLDRMDLILKTVQAFLATPLMESAGKAAMLKPPITKTNVLKMDNNFKGAVALYDYVIAYEGDGYTITREIHTVGAGEGSLSEDVADVELLLAHLTYRHGLGLTPELKAEMEKDENETRLRGLRHRAEQLEGLRRRLEREGEAPEAYILELEKLIRALHGELDRLDPLHAELDRRKKTELALTGTVEDLQARIEGFDREVAAVEEAHALALQEADLRHRREQAILVGEQAAEREAWEAETREIEARRREAVSAMEATLAAKQAEADRYRAAYDELVEETRLLRARVLGKRMLEGDISAEEVDAMTDEEGFNELERELDAFVKLYSRVWKKTKRKIRRDLLNPKSIKGQSGKK